MKLSNQCLLVCLISLASGCAAQHQDIVLAPVGPPRLVEGHGSTEGYLVVHSALDINVSDPEHNSHSSYRIFSSNGPLVMKVQNRAGSFSGDPSTVGLPPGRYNVVAKASGFGIVTVPVVIETGKTTSVHLDGSEPTGGRQTSTSESVRLPDGLIVGWRARQNEETK